MPNTEVWKFINSFAPWLSAVGTLSAVITSLVLATQDRRIRLRVKAGIRVIVEQGSTRPFPEVIYISATNTGRRPARVISFYWKCGLFPRMSLIQTHPENSLSHMLPGEIKDGEEIFWSIPCDLFLSTKNIETISKHWLAKICPWLYYRSMKVGAYLSTGSHAESFIEKSLRELMTQKTNGRIKKSSRMQ